MCLVTVATSIHDCIVRTVGELQSQSTECSDSLSTHVIISMAILGFSVGDTGTQTFSLLPILEVWAAIIATPTKFGRKEHDANDSNLSAFFSRLSLGYFILISPPSSVSHYAHCSIIG